MPYDYFNLVSFLDASPSLETLILNVRRSFIHSSCANISDASLGPLNSIILSFSPSGDSMLYGA